MGRVIVIVLGVVVALFGLLFALQGFGVVGGSPMSNTTTWSIGVRRLSIRSSSNSSMSAVDGLPPRRRIDALTAASSDSCRSMALTSRCLTTPQSPESRTRHSIVGAETSLSRY